MKIAAVACFCIILTGMAWPETVTVNAGLPQPPELSSSHVRIAVMLDGKPLKGARVDLYRRKDPGMCGLYCRLDPWPYRYWWRRLQVLSN